MKNKVVTGVDVISFGKKKTNHINLKDNFYIDCDILLLNCKEWKKLKLYDKIDFYVKSNKAFESLQENLNFFTDTRKIQLNPEFIYMDIINSTDKYEYEYLKLYQNVDPIIFHYQEINNNISLNSFMNEYLIYDNILKTLQNYHLLIPVVLSSNNKYVPFIYTTLVSILENTNRKAFYLFYLLVPSYFSTNNKNDILKLNNKYKCNITFIYPEKYLKNVKINSSDLTSFSYYRLIVADLLPNNWSKCIYLDLDICVCKDLTELFIIDLKDNYIAEVVDPEYYYIKCWYYK